MLLVVIEDLLDRLDTRVLITLVILAGRLLVPIKDLERLCEFPNHVHFPSTHTSNERRNESHAGLCTSNGLAEPEEKRKVAMDLVLALQFTGSLDTLPSACDLDQDALLRDTNRFIEFNQVQGLVYENQLASSTTTVEAMSKSGPRLTGLAVTST